MAAIVNRAVDDVFASKGKGAMLVSSRDCRAAKRWLLSPARGPFTAQWCYAMVGIDGAAAREALSKLMEGIK